ncbi:MAG: twin-arginine translocation signal domain-containing protein, partial [Planctomycetes bacterium]|nr:twin-arginine translocation signal domain-containing protein [Planctomycetota bacterium]
MLQWRRTISAGLRPRRSKFPAPFARSLSMSQSKSTRRDFLKKSTGAAVAAGTVP